MGEITEIMWSPLLLVFLAAGPSLQKELLQLGLDVAGSGINPCKGDDVLSCVLAEVDLSAFNLEPVKVEPHLLQHPLQHLLQHPLQHLLQHPLQQMVQQMAQRPWESAGVSMSCSKGETSSPQLGSKGPICAWRAALRTWSAPTGLSTREDFLPRV